MAESAEVNLIRAAIINYTIIRGDAFAPPPVSFEIEHIPNTIPPVYDDEDFTGAALKMQIRAENKRIMAELINGDGIAVSGNELQYSIDAAAMEEFTPGIYRYDVQKTLSGIISTIQRGTITVTDETTQ